MPYVTLSVRARPNCPGSSGDLAPPALCPGRKVAGQCGRIGEVHRFHDFAVRHRFSQIVRQCDGLVRRTGELLFGKALLSLRREQNVDVFVRELHVGDPLGMETVGRMPTAPSFGKLMATGTPFAAAAPMRSTDQGAIAMSPRSNSDTSWSAVRNRSTAVHYADPILVGIDCA